jgi:toxin YoeB
MKDLALTPNALDDLEFWAQTNPKTLRQIFKLLKDIGRDPHKGLGKPEPLKFNLHGCWSRRIDLEHRIVYRVQNDQAQIISCRYHYK